MAPYAECSIKRRLSGTRMSILATCSIDEGKDAGRLRCFLGGRSFALPEAWCGAMHSQVRRRWSCGLDREASRMRQGSRSSSSAMVGVSCSTVVPHSHSRRSANSIEASLREISIGNQRRGPLHHGTNLGPQRSRVPLKLKTIEIISLAYSSLQYFPGAGLLRRPTCL